jgi:uncharacterized protein YfaS (alpha-2-macroglobulin family)
MSRFMPLMTVTDALKELEVPPDSVNKDFSKIVESGLKRLYELQNEKGGWGWYGNDPQHIFMTSYVVYGLVRAKKTGSAVDGRVLERGIDVLETLLAYENNSDLQAYALFALSYAGEPDAKKAKELAASAASISPYAKALLALALKYAGENESAATVLRLLEKDAILDGAFAHFETPNWYYKWENVAIETTAYALKAFVEIEPASPLIPKMADWLVSMRKGGAWNSTKDTAAAIFGLIEYSRKCGGDFSKISNAVNTGGGEKEGPKRTRQIKIVLNGKIEREMTLDFGNPAKSRFGCFFEPNELATGENVISCAFEPDNMITDVECVATLKYSAAGAAPPAKTNGLSVRTEYERPPASLSVGTETRVTVSIEPADDADFIILQSPIPAGASVVKSSEQGDMAAFEQRFDEAQFFVAHLKKGEKKEFSYKIRADYAGRYSILQPSAALMYNTDVNGKGAAAEAVIK